MEGYIRTPKWFRNVSGIFRSTGELREFVLGLNGPYGKGEKGPKGWPHPSPWTSPNWTREGGAAPLPCPIRTRGGGGARPALPPLPLSAKAHEAHYTPRGVPVSPRYSGKCPNSSRTIPMSTNSRPIYQSSCLGHFETPLHVRDHIRNSELPSVHKNT